MMFLSRFFPLGKHPSASLFVFLFGVGAFLVALLALSQELLQANKPQKSNTVILLDTTTSMLVEDEDGRSRIQAAIASLLAWKTKNPDTAVTLIAAAKTVRILFAANPSISALEQKLSPFIENPGDTISDGPVAWNAAFLAGLERLSAHDHLIVISDGQEKEDGALVSEKTRQELLHKEITSFWVTVGSQEGGKIPLGTNILGKPFYKQYHGQDVVARSFPEALANAAQATRGTFLSRVTELKNQTVQNPQPKSTTLLATLASVLLGSALLSPFFYRIICRS